MIIQISLVRNELPLIKELLPIWSQYADGFVFLLDRNTDGTVEYLNSVKDQYNVLELIEHNPTEDELIVETNLRQLLFDTARKYTNNIICLDADEYLSGAITKDQLESLLQDNPNTLFHLQWLQYTSVNTIRIDGPWKINYKDRIGAYTDNCQFSPAQNHSTHLPTPNKQSYIEPAQLHIVHMQWLNKKFVAIKQYYWKVYDYVNNVTHNTFIVGNQAYDDSVNDFKWEEEYTYDLLKISPFVFEQIALSNNYRIQYIKEQTKKYNIPNLGDWGFDILNMDETDYENLNPYKISIITAVGPLHVYNKFIPRYIDNVKDQHFFQQSEHIIVYSEWSEHFDAIKNLPNFKFIKEDEKRGVYNAWNLGIQAASTDFVTNWNIDDLRHPLNTKIKYDLLVANDYQVVYSYYVGVADEQENFYNIDISTKTYLQYPDNYELYAMQGCFLGPDPMWRKSLHDTVGYFDYKNFNTIGDWEMWIRFAKAGAKFKLIPEVLCLYLDHESTVSRTQLDRTVAEKERLYQKYSNNKTAALVLAVYEEDLSWLDKITNNDIDIVLINKGVHTQHHRAKCITIENIGVCDNSFAYYISKHYDELPDYIIFSQGHPFDHYQNMIEFINTREYEKGYQPLADQTINIPRGEGTTRFVENMLDYHFPGIDFPAGAQYCVPRERILSKPKSFWDDLYDMLPWKEDTFTAYFMERTWHLLYNPEIKVKPNYRESDYFTLKQRMNQN